jgi:hypothetical protein
MEVVVPLAGAFRADQSLQTQEKQEESFASVATVNSIADSPAAAVVGIRSAICRWKRH